jgi:hypothetical protein
MSNPSDDNYAREVIRTVEAMSRQLVEFRQDISRATLPLYPRIVEIERQMELEARERPARQKALDKKLAAQDQELEQQTVALDQIRKWQRARVVIEFLVIVGVVVYLLWR